MHKYCEREREGEYRKEAREANSIGQRKADDRDPEGYFIPRHCHQVACVCRCTEPSNPLKKSLNRALIEP